MELETQPSNPSSPYNYMTAPNTPKQYSRSSSMEFYYSAPSSPRRNTNKNTIDDHRVIIGSNLDDFEFETSKKFEKTDDNFDPPVGPTDSIPGMAFADELFLNGLVMPLKLPPRLQYDSDFGSYSHQRSPVSSSPKSPRTVCRIPFARKNSWNDDFDPFTVALQKVREEKGGRNSCHRRSRSYSPFRAIGPKCSNDSNTDCSNLELSRNSSPTLEQMQVKELSYSGPIDFKGSAYARWVLDQTREGLRSPESLRGSLFRKRVRPLKTEHDVGTTSDGEKNSASVGESTKVQKLRGFLMKYASFGKEKSGSKQMKTNLEVRKPSYFSRLSFKFKGDGHGNGKKSVTGDAKNMAVVQYKPSLACLGYGVGSPTMLK